MGTRRLDADLLVIGGGSAGCMAANRALELRPDLRVVVFEKGDIKYGGSIARGMDALNIVVMPNVTTPELYLEAVTESCHGIVDAAPSYEMATRSYDLLKKLEGWGVHFPLDESGHYRVLKYHVKGRFQADMREPDLKTIIARQAQEKGSFVVNRVMGVQVLKDGERAAGAVGLDVRTGELVVCKAKAVILAAGGQARFTVPNTGYLYGTFDFPGNSGDGFAMAYRAGAEMIGMEFPGRIVIIKDLTCPLLAICVTRGARLLDVFENLMMEGECVGIHHMESTHMAGKGPLRVRMSHLPSEVVGEIESILFGTERPCQERFFKQRGIDFRKDDIELWPTEYQLCGGHCFSGVQVNRRAESSVSGLYAAGDVACVPLQHLTGAFVFGEVAAESAVSFMESAGGVALDDAQVRAAEKQRNERFTTVGREVEVRDLEYKVRRLIGDYVVGLKNEFKLRRWMEWAQRFENEIAHEVLIRDGHELSKLYEIENIVQCATLSARAALERTESRGVHHRVDYPDRDDQNWLRHVVIRRGASPESPVLKTRAVQGLNA
jgi:succinate dehydrogenase/fumarate reductase flavoprotein subunit